ncbi:hypothetical protein B296_00016958 [Ensete ventricosum]|uniref:Uncharacterized protein n=1 Tax=Ensete ventricosum TaxID=4639 RepID=A0A426ZZJ6_ENSVE|nr:hypothetical protein B296_00016958 [Ensete ventricosum]
MIDPRAARARGQRSGEDNGHVLLSSFPFFFFNRSPTINFSVNRPSTAEINRRRSILAVATGPHTDQLPD